VFDRIPRQSFNSDSGAILNVCEFQQIPFLVKRVYWIDGISKDEPRGFHAHKNLNQVIIVLNGKVNLKLLRGKKETNIEISDRDDYVLIPFGTWREIYSQNDIASILVLADCEYQEADYIRDFEQYQEWFSVSFNER